MCRQKATNGKHAAKNTNTLTMRWVSWDQDDNVAANERPAPTVTGINSFLMARDPFRFDITDSNKDIRSNTGRGDVARRAASPGLAVSEVSSIPD